MTRLLIKLGLGVVVPYLFKILVGGAIFGGGMTSWLIGWADWKTAGLLVVGTSLVALLATTDSRAARITMALVVGLVLYLKGRIDQDVTNEADRIEMAQIHAEEIRSLKDGYAKTLDAERARQAKVAEESKREADEAKAKYNQEKAELKALLAQIQEKSANDPKANDLVYTADDIADLNRLRYDPKRDRAKRPAARNRKAKNRKASDLVAPRVPTVAGFSSRGDAQIGGEGRALFGHGEVRRLPPQVLDSGKARGGPGSSIVWWRGF